MADFDPFANQGGPVAWDPEHATDVKKQAAELSRRIAADDEEDTASTHPVDSEPLSGKALIDSDAEVDDVPDGDTDTAR